MFNIIGLYSEFFVDIDLLWLLLFTSDFNVRCGASRDRLISDTESCLGMNRYYRHAKWT